VFLFLLLYPLFIGCKISKDEQSSIITFKKNGGWCWFQDERAIIHNGILIFGTVANPRGFDGEKLDGDVEAMVYDIGLKKHLGKYVLHDNLEADDHNTPAFLLLNDGRILAVYSKHGTDENIRYRKTKKPFDYLNWDSENILTREAEVTYSNLYLLSNENNHEGRIYNFYRGENWNPNYIISDDNGKSWKYGGHLIKFEGRPYVKYISDGIQKIHFITTEHHPHNFANSIYHAYIEHDKIFKTDGTFIKNLSVGPISPEEGTKIFAGDSMNVAWTIDIHLDGGGNPFIAYLVEKDKDPNQISYRYARWDGQSWDDNFLAYAGSALYAAESHYSGLVALDPQNPNIVYISADADPVKGTELISRKDSKRHYEIFKGISEDHGKNWSWIAITRDSDFDNIRPIMPVSDGEYKVLLWLKGKYITYKDYSLDVVGIINP
jgi:hypothetical protein